MLLCYAWRPKVRIGYLQVPYSIIVGSVSLLVMCATCERFGGPWTGWCPLVVRWVVCVVIMAALIIHYSVC